MKYSFKKLFFSAVILVPSLVSAQQLTGIRTLIESSRGIVGLLINLMVALALLVFFWGLAKFIFKIGGDEKAAADGKRLMIWGIIALFVMVSVWGIVYFIQNQLNIGPNDYVPNFNNLVQ